MQDIDFSRRTFPHRIPISAEQSTVSDSSESKKAPGSFFTPLLVTALLTFSLGLIAGIFLAKAQNIEKNIISRPDETYFRNESSRSRSADKSRIRSSEYPKNRARSSSFTNVPVPVPKEAPFLIKIGVYPSGKAQNLVRRLNLSEKFTQQEGQVFKCKNIKRVTPFSARQFSFAVPVPGMPQQENVLLGCFMNKSSAMTFLAKVLNTSIPETQAAQLFQIAE